MSAASSSALTRSLIAKGVQFVPDLEQPRISFERREAERERVEERRRLELAMMEQQKEAKRQAALAAWFATAIPSPKLTPARIIKRVAKATGYTPDQLKGPSRARDLVLARMAAMYWIRRRLGLSLHRVGYIFGRDHSTALHAIRVYPERRARSRVKLREIA